MFGASSDDALAPEGEFDPSTEPTPGEFLDGHDVLTGDAHVAFHDTTRALFEERGVYDMTFGYNLADLNRDTRHSSAGYRYAEAADDPDVLLAEFTPTTPFCPQSDTLTRGSFRAWNGLADRHGYDLVRVRVSPMHQRSADINDALADMEAEFRETGELPDGDASPGEASAPPTRDETTSTDAPF
ncbi:hypothetical protein [Halobacterium jilantaiense]|uniref:DUF7998 domain-containing protein n=1 Tax=Halobacterium jilantaiense TaxID=355548 RepID=A0A1I0MHM7_9EURY|nr:hypothetical protein [Halobacterium jilantaiense]SEV87260.1 hypothetical protein SAMN04487945_0035 [Halobacterium jilantaiense]